MASVTVEIPDDLLVKSKNRGSEAGPALRLAAAFSLCSRGELSTSQAARLAGLTYADSLEAAAKAKVELFPIDFEELKKEIPSWLHSGSSMRERFGIRTQYAWMRQTHVHYTRISQYTYQIPLIFFALAVGSKRTLGEITVFHLPTRCSETHL
jgi:predicted HTH domain antitoxin